MDRRTFLKDLGLASAAALSGPVARPLLHPRAASSAALGTAPNILVILVDQMRSPQWFPAQASLDQLLPNLARLRTNSVTFGRHYTAATACTPARACLLTGLYAHQSGCLLTQTAPGIPDLHPAFPTWGTALRALGYQTAWFGKWHLSLSCDLSPYGFSGGTCPSPNGAPGQGLAADPAIATQFATWLAAQGTSGPWCTTVSLVNPHDIGWYYKLSNQVPAESQPPSVFTQLAPNFEALATLQQSKPSTQAAYRQEIEAILGALPDSGSGFPAGWLSLLNLYLLLHAYVDGQIGRVLSALAAQPAVAARTIVLFTADHGEYGGSHGLRNKGGAVYEEAIRVPLYVWDPTGTWTSSLATVRTQLTSSVDVLPLLLTLAGGGNAWRAQPQYAHLATRLDLSTILQNPQATGRPYILHTTDEDVVEGPIHTPVTTVPKHIIGLRLARAKLGLYSYWAPGTLSLQSSGQELECYDYMTMGGQLEVANAVATEPGLTSALQSYLLSTALPNELRQPLPASLQPAQQAAVTAYLSYQASI
jgi:arylsulfatase A-like enzyme